MQLRTPLLSLSASAVIALLGACATPPAPPPKTATVAPAPAPRPAAAPVAAIAPALPEFPHASAPLNLPPPPTIAAPAPAMNPEVTALVVHLTESEKSDTLAHDLVDTTGFPEAIASLAPGAVAPKVEKVSTRSQPPPRGLTADGDSVNLEERDWTGLVLVPINKSLSKAYTSGVRLLKVEAHPLQDGRIRVWIRLQNIAKQDLGSEVACSFSMRADEKPMSPYFYELKVPSREYRDVFFVSPAGELVTYTVLIRSNQVNYRVSQR